MADTPDWVLPLIEEIRILHLGKDDRIFIRVKEAKPDMLATIKEFFEEHFPHNLVYVLDHRVAVSIVRPDSELAKLLDPYPSERFDGSDDGAEWAAECEEFGCHEQETDKP